MKVIIESLLFLVGFVFPFETSSAVIAGAIHSEVIITRGEGCKFAGVHVCHEASIFYKFNPSAFNTLQVNMAQVVCSLISYCVAAGVYSS